MTRNTVLFLSAGPHLGGAQASLLTLLRALPEAVDVVLAAPSDGAMIERVRVSTSVSEHVVTPNPDSVGRRRAWLGTAVVLGRWLVRNRRRLRAVHANGETELKLLLPVLPLARVPIIVWYHSKRVSPSTIRLAPLWRRSRGRVVWAPVSEASRRELIATRVAISANSFVVPNPIDKAEVVPRSRQVRRDSALIVGYLGLEEVSKGLVLLPQIAEQLQGFDVRLVVVTKDRPREANSPIVNEALDRLRALQSTVAFRARDRDVRKIYADLDILLIPSLAESFCRVAAEAMLNRLPVVASDLPALRELLGDDEAGLLFPVGDADAAALALRRLVVDPDLRARLADAAPHRVAGFTPQRIAAQLLALYARRLR